MSNIIFCHQKRGTEDAFRMLQQRVALGAGRLSPNTPGARRPASSTHGRCITAVVNPCSGQPMAPGCVAVGHVAGPVDWASMHGELPEGTYAICRSDGRDIELLTDAVGTRTLWYYMDNSLLIASTSQRWIAVVLGTFHPNERVLPWVLTTGTPGPVDGWDRRVLRLQGHSRLVVDVDRWTSRLETHRVEFASRGRDVEESCREFREGLRASVGSCGFDYSRWVLPLSGGYDSRGILCMLGRTEGLRTVTWGTAAAVSDSESDAAVAAALAREAGVEHEYFRTDVAPGSLEDVFRKFVACGEGRTCNVTGYLDGFAIWERLLSQGVEGVIRGDEGFGWKRVDSLHDARRSVGLHLWNDFTNLPASDRWDLPEQELPGFLAHREAESPGQWRDRLYHQYRIPTLLAGLTDLKARFVEVANPLLAPAVVRLIRRLPDGMRTEKRLYREVVDDLGPAVPYADSRSIADQREVLRSAEALEILHATVSSAAARKVFSGRLLALLKEKLPEDSQGSRPPLLRGLKKRLRKHVPRAVRNVSRPRRMPMDHCEMAFRVHVASAAVQLLEADAEAGRTATPAPPEDGG